MSNRPQTLQTPLLQLRGVGPERAAQLERLDLRSVEDLLLHAPRRYEDRRRFQRLAELQLDHPALTCGKIIAAGLSRYRHGARSLFEFILDDGTARLHCRWWNLPYMEKYFTVGDQVVVFGKPNSLRPRTMDHPETEVIQSLESSIHLNRIAPVYPLTEGLPQRWLRSLIWRLLQEFAPGLPEPHPEIPLANERVALESPIPQPAVPLPSRSRSLQMLHFPEEMADVEIARRRLALDEYVELQLAMRTRRKNLEARASTRPCAGDNNRLIKPFLAGLGFELTASQTRVLREIRRDLGGPRPMRRLLQGDVASGKTVVAACAMLMALESGADAVLMAPTEILAAQHFQNFRRWMEPLGVPVALHTGGSKIEATPPPAPHSPFPILNSQFPILHIGTHALLEESFAPERLGLVIIDEQHKFGVGQREELVRKGSYPHLLVMTATPIPRTLGLTLYGDLDISVIDQAPPGRGRVKTFLRPEESLPKVWAFLRENLARGRQAYIIYSRLEDADSAARVKAATREFGNLERTLAPWRVGLLHGRLKSQEKEKVMEAFRLNQTRVLLATSVVEVGLDVPNATLMVIENAEQFGLAQLHQLRGRIGRGARESYCILVAAGKSPEARARLKIMEETTDGFRIAEEDLRLRGAGELLGRQQSGLPRLRFGNLSTDRELVERARALVREKLG